MAFDKIAEAFVEIGTKLNPLEAGLAQAKGMVASAAAGMGGAAVGALAAVGIAAGVGATMAYALKSFWDAEAASKALESALRANGQAVDDGMEKLKGMADAFEKLTGKEAESMMGAQRLGLNLGLTTDQAAEASKAAAGLAQAYGIDIQTAMQAVSKEMQGVKSSLDRQIPALNGVEDAQQRLAIISKAGATGMQQAFEAGDTGTGSFEKLKNTVGDVLESLGSLISAGLTPVMQWFNTMIQTVMQYATTCDSTFSGVGSAASSMGSIIGSIFSTIGSVLEKLTFGAWNVGLYFKIAGLEIASAFMHIPDAVRWAYNKVYEGGLWVAQNLGDMFFKAIDYLIGAFAKMGNYIKDLFTRLWDWIAGGGTKAWVDAGNNFSQKLELGIKKIPGEWQSATDKIDKQLADAYGELDKRKSDWQKVKDDVTSKGEQEALSKVNLSITDEGKKRQDEKDKDKDKSSGNSFISLADVWKQTQEAALKKQDDGSKKILEETKKGNKIAEEQMAWFKDNFALNV